MRVYEATVTARGAGAKLEKYVSQAFPLLPARVIRDAFAARDVKMDGRRAGREEPVPTGARVQLYTDFALPLPVVYEDERVLLLNKPAGITCDDDPWGGMTGDTYLERNDDGTITWHEGNGAERFVPAADGDLQLNPSGPSLKVLTTCVP